MDHLRDPPEAITSIKSLNAAVLEDASSPPRPSLLPAFEPFSSSPIGLPKVTKRKFDQTLDDRQYYPTPVPTSSTGILPSSPNASIPAPRTRPGLQRTVSTLSERAPLGDVPRLDLPFNGVPLQMGRSSNSSDYQLSANRHISRVHVRASYLPPDALSQAGKVEIECLGWNGAKVHCGGEITELVKGGTFVSTRPFTQIIVDVQDTRVMLNWPKEARDLAPLPAGEQWPEVSPVKRRMHSVDQLGSSPPAAIIQRSPFSPQNMTTTFNSTFRADQSPVKVYEDHSSDEDAPHEESTPVPLKKDAVESLQSVENEELSEHDEENDPIVHSFGPFGENILSKLESFQPTSPLSKRKPLTASPKSSQNITDFRPSPVKNHVINQLAYAKVHSLPLSTIHTNLPAELRGAMVKPSDTENQAVLSTSGLKTLLDEIPCVGEISREGKDAAGKLLESEFYYIPEKDHDESRRENVTQSLGRTSIRSARKQHKQYYWKRPRH